MTQEYHLLITNCDISHCPASRSGMYVTDFAKTCLITGGLETVKGFVRNVIFFLIDESLL